MMELTFREVLKNEVQKLHSVETQLTDAIKMQAKMAQHPDLKKALESHHTETVQQVRRLETIAQRHGFSPIGMPCLVLKAMQMELLIELHGAEPGPAVDATLVSAGQKVEMLEVAFYRNLTSIAREMGDEEMAALLEESLQEEQKTDDLLRGFAEESINRELVQSSRMAASV